MNELKETSAVNTNKNVSTTKKTERRKSYADIVNNKENTNLNISNIRNLLRTEKIEEQEEERRKESKASNLIIHGVKEKNESIDKEFVNY